MELNKVLKILFDSATEGILVVNTEQKIVLTNPRTCELFGYDKGELIGESLTRLVPREHIRHHKYVEGYMNKPKKRLMGGNNTLYGVKKNGDRIPLEISLNTFEYDDVRYAMAFIVDVTEREHAKAQIKQLNEELEQKVEDRTQKLKESQDLYKLIARNFPNGTINVFDEDLKYVFVEGKELFKLGIESSHLVGSYYLDRLSEDIRPMLKNKLSLVFEGLPQEFEIKYKSNYYAINAVPLYYENGKVHQILMVEQNITLKKEADEKLKQALEKERELGDLKSRFVSMASHEFRTPLSTILSSVNLMERYKEMEQFDKQDKHFLKIKKSISNLTNILNDILSISKIEEGKIQSEFKSFNLNELLEDIVGELSSNFKNGQKISMTCDVNITMESDEKLIRIIFNNLLSNALKYSEEDVLMNVNLEGDSVCIKVEDKGIGIPKTEQTKLFERFFRANNVTNIQGTGLGLNIVKSYVDFLKGIILVESEEEQGTIVRVKLPLINKV